MGTKILGIAFIFAANMLPLGIAVTKVRFQSLGTQVTGSLINFGFLLRLAEAPTKLAF